MDVTPSMRPQSDSAWVRATRPLSLLWFSSVVAACLPCWGSSSSRPVTLGYSCFMVSSAASSSFPLASTSQAEAAPVITAAGWHSVISSRIVVGKRLWTWTSWMYGKPS